MVKACRTWIPARLSDAIADVSPPHLRARRVAAFIRMVAEWTVIASSGRVASDSRANGGAAAPQTGAMPLTTHAVGRETGKDWARGASPPAAAEGNPPRQAPP